MSLELRDKVLEPFFIKVDEYSVDVYLSKVREGGAKEGDVVEISKGSYNDLNYALKYIIKERTRLKMETEKASHTVDEYIVRLQKIESEIAKYKDTHLSLFSLKKLIEESLPKEVKKSKPQKEE